MQYAKYFANKMRLSQGYNDKNHAKHSGGNYKDYPVDETYGDSQRNGYFLMPCDSKIVKMYGPAVGNNCISNQIWLTSTDKVKMPCGEDYLTYQIGHISNADMKNYKVGSTLKQGSKLAMEYKDANSSGPHHHVAFGKGKMKGTGWVKNNYNIWVITTGGTIKPEEALYVDKTITKIIDSRGIVFKELPNEEPVTNSFFGSKGWFGLGDKHENIGKIATFMRKTFPAYTSEKALGNYYGENIKSAIKEFQKRTGLEADGNVGPITLKKLKEYGFKD